MELWEHINFILYTQNNDDKFIKSEVSGKSILNPKYISRLSEYNAIKDFILSNSSEDKTKINVVLIRQLIKSLFLKFDVQVVKFSIGELKLPRDIKVDYLLVDILKELSITSPTKVEAALENCWKLKDNIESC